MEIFCPYWIIVLISSKQILLILLNGSVIHYVLTLKSEEGEGLLDWQGAVLSKHWICVQPRCDCCRGNIPQDVIEMIFELHLKGWKFPFFGVMCHIGRH